jgi:hypothetical protein
MTKKERLIQCITNAIKYNMELIAVVVKLPTGDEELIINKRGAFMDKLNYYDVAYDDDLKLKDCSDIEIVSFTSANSLFAIEGDLYE